jgi:hypothetical protein
MYGFSELSNDDFVGSTASFFCNKGYTLIPTGLKLECKAQNGIGVWEKSKITIQCIEGMKSSWQYLIEGQ